MSITFTPKKGSKKVITEGYVQAFLSRQRDRELPFILKLQGYRNKFFDWYFFIASILGEEVFFISFIPFCCWNVSRQVALHLAFLLAFSVGGGNMLKNLLQSPRPPHKVVWVNKSNPEPDPGFPSTHTMTAFTIPWYLLIFYWDVSTTYTKMMGFAILVFWSVSIALSRIYNGHHFIVDVIGGFSLAVGILTLWTSYLRYVVDTAVLDPSIFFPMVLVVAAIFLLYIHPLAATPNPAAAETALVLGVPLGTTIGVWSHLAFKWTTGFGIKIIGPLPLVSSDLVVVIARFIIGVIAVAFIREISKFVFLPILLHLHKWASQTKKSAYNKTNYKYSPIDVALKLITYTAVSLTVVFSPNVCCMLGLFHESDLIIFMK